MYTHIGFTGTSRGMTQAQKDRLADYLRACGPFIIHHGDCVGADAEFDEIARGTHSFKWAVIHPCTLVGMRANVKAGARDDVRAPKAPLERNKDIVRLSDIMLSAPKEDRMVLRSGTWATTRYARELARPLWLFLPSGAKLHEPGK